MRKAGLITLAVLSVALITSCASSKSGGNGYFGVSNKKVAQKRQKEFQKPKHKIVKSHGTKVRN